MQVVSGALGKEKIHFEAPDARVLNKEMNRFLKWFNKDIPTDPLIKAGIAHFWFVTIHPFDDGNGRIARAIADMQLARAEGNVQRFYSMSAQIRVLRKEYYGMLEKTQQGKLDITPWLEWFLHCLKQALQQAERLLEEVLAKAAFWQKHAKTMFNPRQQLMINKLLDQFTGKLSTSKWAKIAKCSPDTALRDIQDLMQKGVLQKEAGGGRSTSYTLIYYAIYGSHRINKD